MSKLEKKRSRLILKVYAIRNRKVSTFNDFKSKLKDVKRIIKKIQKINRKIV